MLIRPVCPVTLGDWACATDASARNTAKAMALGLPGTGTELISLLPRHVARRVRSYFDRLDPGKRKAPEGAFQVKDAPRWTKAASTIGSRAFRSLRQGPSSGGLCARTPRESLS